MKKFITLLVGIFILLGCNNIVGSQNLLYQSNLKTAKDISKPFIEKGLKGNIVSIQISSNNKYFISGTNIGLINLWDMKKRKVIRTIKGLLNLTSMTLSSDNRYIAVGYKNFELKAFQLWSLKNGKEVKIFDAIKPVHSIAFSKDNKYIITGGYKKIGIWDINSTKKIKEINMNSKLFITSLTINHKNNYIISGDSNGIINIYNMKSGKKIKTLKGHTSQINSIAITSDDKYIISGSKDKTIKIWSLKNGKELKTLKGHNASVNSIAISFNNQYIVSGSQDKTIKIWSLKSGKELKTLKGHNFPLRSIALTSDDKYIISGANTLKIWDFKTFKELKELKNNLQGNKIWMNKNYFFMSNSHTKLWDRKSGKYIKTKYTGGQSTTTSLDNKYMISANRGKMIYVKSLETEELKKSFKTSHTTDIHNIVMSPNNRYIASASNDKTIKIFDLQKDKEFILIGHNDKVRKIIFSSNSKFLVSISSDKTIRIWDIENKKEMRKITTNSNLLSINISKNNKYIVVGGMGIVQVWDFKTGKNIKNFKGHIQKTGKNGQRLFAIYAVAISFNNKYIVSGDTSGTLILWNIENGQEIKKFTTDLGSITFLSISEDNKLIFSGSTYGIQIWDVKKKDELVSMISFKDGEWITITPEGFFDSSTNGAKYLNIRFNGLEVTDIERFYDHFFRPDLVKLKLAGEEEAYQKAIGKLDYREALTNPSPTVKMDKKNSTITSNNKIKLSFNIQDNGGGVGLIRIYQEGKLIQTIGEGVVKRQSANIDTVMEQDKLDTVQKKKQEIHIASIQKASPKRASLPATAYVSKAETITTTNRAGKYSIEVDLKSGKNEITIEAFNKTNTVASYRESITINAQIPKRKPKLYVIVAGVNQFQSKAGKIKPLKYSVNDAKAIKKAVEQKMHKVFDDIEVIPLIEKDLTKANIYKFAKEISLKAHLEDTVLFYISTHGRSRGGRLYLVPQNNKSAKNWIDFEQTFKAIQSIKALNQIFVIDACESGTANDIVSAVYDSKASVLAKSSGVHMLLATTRGTNAFESDDPKVKNGVFTHRILEALRSRGTDLNKDNFISIKEVSTELRKPQSNSEFQYPVIRNVGSDVRLEKLN